MGSQKPRSLTQPVSNTTTFDKVRRAKERTVCYRAIFWGSLPGKWEKLTLFLEGFCTKFE